MNGDDDETTSIHNVDSAEKKRTDKVYSYSILFRNKNKS